MEVGQVGTLASHVSCALFTMSLIRLVEVVFVRQEENKTDQGVGWRGSSSRTMHNELKKTAGSHTVEISLERESVSYVVSGAFPYLSALTNL